jgi:hypothetical protein
MAAPKNCPRCGAAVVGVSPLCAKCGAPLNDLQEAPTATAKGSDDVTQLAYLPPEMHDADLTVPVGPLPLPLPLSMGPIPQAKSTEAKTQPFNAKLIEALALRPAAETTPLGKLSPPVPAGAQPKIPTGDLTPLMPSPVTPTPPMGDKAGGGTLANMETSLIPSRLLPRANQGRSSASESPANQTSDDESPPWLHPWVLAVGAMVLLALGLLIGLLLL